MEMERREFLKKTAKAVALAAIAGGTGLYFHNRVRDTYLPVITKPHTFPVPLDRQFPQVVLAKHTDPTIALQYALDAVGGIKRFIYPGERVTIKPNIGWDRTPEQAANTNPILVAEMVRLCLQAGASEVIVTDVSCNDPRRAFMRSGIGEAARQAGAKVVLPAKEDFIKVNMEGELLTVWPVLKHFIYTDRLINMPIVKQHSLSQCTIGMKNFYGILGGRRNKLHQRIDQSIVDLAGFCRPTLTVIDATRVLVSGGPQGGSLDNVEMENSVICSTDQVASDSRSVEFLGLRGEQVGHIALAAKAGLGQLDYRAAGYREIIV